MFTQSPFVLRGAVRFQRFLAALTTGVMVIAVLVPQSARAASSWNPTLLVNTESFETIDEGDSTTDVELRFGGTLNEKILFNRTKGTFQFTDDVSVLGVLSGSLLRVDGAADIHGPLSVTGAIRADGNLTINDDQTAADAVLTFGSDGTNETMTFANTNDRFEFSDDVRATGTITTESTFSGQTLRVGVGGADIHGALNASGAIRADGNLTINDDQTSGDTTMTFGNATGNQTVKFLDTPQKFQLSKGVNVLGNMSGASLTVDGSFKWNTLTYTAPTTQPTNTYLKTDGAGTLTWSAASVANGSGNIMSSHPLYPNAVYFASGSTTVGQLTYAYDTTNKQNYYRWTSSKSARQDYWVATRIQLPANFSSWDPVKPIELRYRTGSGQLNGTSTGNVINVKMLDTGNAALNLTGGRNLANASWTTANITGPETAGTWTPKSYFTLLIKLAASTTGSSWFADLGYLNFNFETTTP